MLNVTVVTLGLTQAVPAPSVPEGVREGVREATTLCAHIVVCHGREGPALQQLSQTGQV